MKNFLFILDPEEKEKDYDKSLEGFIGNIAIESVERELGHSLKIGEINSINIFTRIADRLGSLNYLVKTHYTAVGFAVGMAYADLVSKRNPESEKILNHLKRKLKKSGFLPKSLD